MGPVLLIVGGIIAVIILRLIAGGMDGDRVENYIKKQGGRLVSSSWAPLGKGWFGEKDSRIYEIVYIDRQGHSHKATCKTSLFSGVYFTEDEIMSSPDPAEHEDTEYVMHVSDRRLTQLEDENSRLRKEIDELKNKGC